MFKCLPVLSLAVVTFETNLVMNGFRPTTDSLTEDYAPPFGHIGLILTQRKLNISSIT